MEREVICGGGGAVPQGSIAVAVDSVGNTVTSHCQEH